MLTLRMAIAAIVSTYEVRFAPGEEGVSFDEDGLDTFVVTLPPLNLTFEARSRE